MVIIEDKIDNIKVLEDLCAALGTFDGVHYGHQKIIKRAVAVARERGLKSAVITFDCHPEMVIKPNKKTKILTFNNVKTELIKNLGVDYLIFLKFNRELCEMEPLVFLNYLVGELNTKFIVCGYNYTFGKMAKGNTLLLNSYKKTMGYGLEIHERITIGEDKVSSTIIRELITAGQIEEANKLLGYNYFYMGTVVHGKGLAYKLGFPTANIPIPENMCLKNGVYITVTTLNNAKYYSISNVGHSPTVPAKCRLIETFIINFKEEIYGQNIKVEFLNFIRDEVKFSSIEELKNRVLQDIEIAGKYFAHNVYTK